VSNQLQIEITHRSARSGKQPEILAVVEIDAQYLRLRHPPRAREVALSLTAVERFRFVEHGSQWLFPDPSGRNARPGAVYDLIVIRTEGPEHVLPLQLSFEDAAAWVARLNEALTDARNFGGGVYR
jgi:hypothetical protein